MCGIVGYIGAKEAVPVILDGLKRLEYRGYDSAGIAVAGNGSGLQVRRAAGKLCNLEEVVRRLIPAVHRRHLRADQRRAERLVFRLVEGAV